MRPIKQCCCGCSLRTVTLIIGYIHVTLLLLVLFGVIAFIPNYFGSKRPSVIIDGLNFTALFTAMLIIISILLIIGATKGNMLFLLPWIGNTMVGVIAAVFAWIYGLIKVGANPFAALVTFALFWVIAISSLSLWVVISHFEELRNELIKRGSRMTERNTQKIEERVAALEATVDNLGQSV